ncbi:MAG: hypothetical protein AAF726_04830 [Planctomycetota bacterium]
MIALLHDERPHVVLAQESAHSAAIARRRPDDPPRAREAERDRLRADEETARAAACEPQKSILAGERRREAGLPDRRVQLDQPSRARRSVRVDLVGASALRVAHELRRHAAAAEGNGGAAGSRVVERESSRPQGELLELSVERDPRQLESAGIPRLELVGRDAGRELDACAAQAAGDLEDRIEGRRPSVRVERPPAVRASVGVEEAEDA